MPELDIHASAREVADLLNCNRTADAVDRLAALRQGQSLVVQEALDRYVAVDAREQLTVLPGPEAIAGGETKDLRTTLDRLRAATGTPRFPADTETRNLSQTQLHDVYGSIVASRGNQAAQDSLQTNGDRVILGLRNDTRTTVHNGIGAYDDRMVVVWKDNQGTRHAHEFNRANTEPSAQYDHHAGSDGTRRYADGGNTPRLGRSPGYEEVWRRKIEGDDVNRDDVRDLGRLGEGTTEMLATTHPAYRGGRPSGVEFALRPTTAAVATGIGRVQRDTNADGWFTAADVNGIQDLNNTFKIHRGSGGGNTDSAGCQTISGTQYDDFIAEVRRNPQQTRWQYVLTSVEDGQQLHQGREAQPPLHRAPDVIPAPPPRHPADPGHPDHDLHRQIRDRVGMLGPETQENRDRLSLSLFAEAIANGLTRVDHLFPNRGTATAKPGEHLFAIQGRPDDPASARVTVNTAAAINTPTDESLARIENLNRIAANSPSADPPHLNATHNAPGIRLV